MAAATPEATERYEVTGLVQRDQVPRARYGQWLSRAVTSELRYRAGSECELPILTLHDRIHNDCTYAQVRSCVAHEQRRQGTFRFMCYEKSDGKEWGALPPEHRESSRPKGPGHTKKSLQTEFGMCTDFPSQP